MGLRQPFLNYSTESVTAVSFAPVKVDDKYLLAVGLETGHIHIFLWNTRVWRKMLYLPTG